MAYFWVTTDTAGQVINAGMFNADPTADFVAEMGWQPLTEAQYNQLLLVHGAASYDGVTVTPNP